MSSTESKPKGKWGGARPNSGGKPLTDAARMERQLRELGIDPEDTVDPVATFAAILGVSPRVAGLRPDLADRFELVSAGEHLARFARHFCRYNQLGEVGEDGPVVGDPIEFEDFEREYDDEALDCDERGRRLWLRTGVIIGRKNRKTTRAAIKSLYFCSPADGEHRPVVIQAAGVKHQAGKLYTTTKAFIDDAQYGSRQLRRWFVAMQNRILCTSNGGEIFRVAGDGDNNMSLDPHVVVMDELHTWKTPGQRENLGALTTAQGGRLDPFIEFITTEGEGDDDVLYDLMESLEGSPDTEVEHRRSGLTIYRNRRARQLVYRYAAPAQVGGRKTTIDDVELVKLANPAPWRTLERISEDLADTSNPPARKLRLYGNIRSAGEDRWISDELIEQLIDAKLAPPKSQTMVVSVDGAISRDTTACSWSWRHPDGRIVQHSRVWSCRKDRPHDIFVPGGRLDNDLVRDFVAEYLLPVYDVKLLFYDERYFETQANDLSKLGVVAVEMHQGNTEMRAAWDEYYHDVHEGDRPTIALAGDESSLRTISQHIKNAVGSLTDRGWYVTKKGGKNSIRVIDALASNVMGAYGVRHFGDFMPKKPSKIHAW